MIKWPQKINIGLFQMILLGFLFVALTNCNNDRQIKRNQWLNYSSTHVDSIWQFIQEFKDQHKFAETAVNQVNRLRNNPKLIDSSDKLMSILEIHSKLNPNPKFLSYFLAMKCQHAIIQGNDKNVHQFHEKWQSYEPFATANTQISHGLDMGFYSYQKRNYDSAIIHFSKSLDISKSNNDTFYRNIILINLGASFYKLNMYKSANEAFSKALINIENIRENHEITQKIHEIIMLNNNIMASLNQEGRYGEIFSIYDKYKDYLKRSDLNESYKILFKLNYIRALINTQNHTKSKDVFSTIKPLNPDDENYSYYVRVKASSWLNLKHYDSFARCYTNFLPFLYANQTNSINDHLTNLKSGIELGLLELSYDSLYIHYQKLKPTLNNLYTLSNYCSLFSYIEKSKNNTVESLKWRNKELEFSLAFSENSGFIQISNIQEEIKRAKIFKKVSDQEYLIEKSKLRQNWLTATSVIFGALLIVLALLFISVNKSRKKQISILGLEAELKKKEVELLKIQNEKQANSVITSNMAIQKISELSNFIRQSDLAKNPTMIDIRMNLDRLTEVVYKEYNEEVQEDIFQNYNYLREKYPITKDLNTTSFRVMVLSILENTPKDISNLLNLNMQYVRNIRSKIKKDLQSELGEDWDWPDLK